MGRPSVLSSWTCLLAAWLTFSAAMAAEHEPSRVTSACFSDQFSCGRKCIPYVKVCDNEVDCDDGSDEANCHPELICKLGEFKCAKDGKCIPIGNVCNGYDDCLDGADERQPACGETKPHFVIAEGRSISKVYPATGGEKPLVMQLFLSDMQVHPIDYFWSNQTIVAFDNQHHIGFDVKHDGNGWIRKDRIPTMPLTVSNIAVDQASGNLYFVDPEKRIVGVLSDASMKVIVGHNDDVYPYGVAVDAQRGYLYFSDLYGSGGVIRKCYLDGSNCVVLFHTAGLPRGITIDPFEGYLYYADVNLHLIGKVKLDGTDHSIVHRPKHKGFPDYLVVDGKHCYWTDGTTPNIFYVDRTGRDATEYTIPLKSAAAFGITMVPPSQGNVRNKCSVNNGGCSHFCFANPDGLRCACPLNSRLDVDGKKCIDNAPQCPPAAKFLCGSGECLSYDMLCNGVANCRDASDEVNCTKTTCQKNDFLCDDWTCLSPVHVCNGISNCASGLDEVLCGECVTNFFSCGNGLCIHSTSVCNGKLDCMDGKDETSSLCNLVVCSPDEYPCSDGRHCVPLSSRCNGRNECPDASDERGCEKRCGRNGVKCDENNRQSVDREKEWHDVPANDNGAQVATYKCNEEQFQCANTKHCISLSWKCDKEHDCNDGSDEWDCGDDSNRQALDREDEGRANREDAAIFSIEAAMCSAEQFRCVQSSECISLSRKCDKEVDCSDESDELDCSDEYTAVSLALFFVSGVLVLLCVVAVITLLVFCINSRRTGRPLPSWFQRLPFRRLRNQESIYAVETVKGCVGLDGDKMEKMYPTLVFSIEPQSTRMV